MFQLRWLRGPSYSLLGESDSKLDSRKPSILSKISWPFLGTILVATGFALGHLSAAVGTRGCQPALKAESDIAWLSKTLSETSPHVFLYNRTFGEDSSSADAAWTELLPHQGGYFTHPDLAPKRATFSVYHYLHCLNGIREGYWAVYDKAVAGEKLEPDDKSLPMMISPPHIRHCIDLLRQSLMCNPDLTVEIKDEEAGGVHGFGETHQCVDWMALNEWTTRRETWKPLTPSS